MVKDNAYHSANVQKMPPAVFIESIGVRFRSWLKPIISVDLNGIEVNIVVQKGGLAIPKLVDDDHSAFSLFLGDMTMQEAMRYMPKPPEKEGIYPMVGLVNIKNLSFNALELKVKNGQSILRTLAKLQIPNEIFRPLANLTTSKSSLH